MLNSNHDRQLIVSGFHRSGTSLTMQALNNAGLFLGANLMPAHPSNPDGHFENTEIVSLHDKLLATRNRRWYTPGGPLSAIEQVNTHSAQKLIDEYMNASSVWGFKDPRSCFFLDWWHAMLPNAGAVLVYRHYLPCYQSLRNREAQILAFNPASSLHFWQNPLLGFQLWLDYNQALLSYVRRTPHTTLLVSCEAMMSGFDLVTAVNERFGLSLDTQSASGIRQHTTAKRKHTSVLSTIPATLLNELNATLEELKELAIAPAADTPVLAIPGTPPPQHALARTQSLLDELGVGPVSADSAAVRVVDAGTVANLTSVASMPAANTTGDEIDFIVRKIKSAGQQNCIADATQIVDDCLTTIPDDLRIHIAAGRFFLDHALYPDAEEQFRSAFTLNPGNPASLLHLGFLENNRQQFLKASHYLEMAIARQPGNAILHFHQSNALLRAGKHRGALQACEQGLTIDPANCKLNGLKTRLLIDSGNTPAARIHCAKLIDQCPDEHSYYALLSELESATGNTEAASYHFHMSVWKKIVLMPDYRQQLLDAIGGINERHESQALHAQVNREIEKLIGQVQIPVSGAMGQMPNM